MEGKSWRDDLHDVCMYACDLRRRAEMVKLDWTGFKREFSDLVRAKLEPPPGDAIENDRLRS